MSLSDFPPAWLTLGAIAFLIGTFFYRWRYALSFGGRFYIFLALPFAYIGFIVALSVFGIDGFGKPDVIALALRLCSLMIMLVWGFINFVEARFQRHITHELVRLGLLPNART